MSEVKNLKLEVRTNSEETQKEFTRLREEIKKTTDQVDELSKEFGENSKEADEARKKLSQLSQAYDTMTQSATDLGASFEQVYGELQPLTTRMGEAEDRLYELANAGQTASQEYQDLLETVGRYRKIQIQTDLAVDSAATTMAQKLGGALGGVTAGFELGQGVMGAFGAESEQVEKALLKVQSAMAIAQGVQGIKESIPMFMSLRTAAMTAFAGMTTASKIFMTAGIGVLITGVGLLMANFDKVANFFTGELDRNARYTKSLNKSARAIRDNAKELDERADALKRNQDFEYAMAEAQGATTKELRKMKIAQADERIELEKDSVARAENIYWLAKHRYQKLVNADADEDIIKKAKENAKEAREILTNEKDDLKQARQDKKDIQNQIKVDDAKAKQDQIKASNDLAKSELDIIKENQKAATDLQKDEAQVQIEAIEAKYKEQIKLAKKYGKDTTDLEIARDKEIKAITDTLTSTLVDMEVGKLEVRKATIDKTLQLQKLENEGLKDGLELKLQIAETEKELNKQKIADMNEALQATSDTLGQVADLFGEQSSAGKAAAIAQATIDTYLSAQKAYTSTVGIPIVGPVLAPINAGLAIAAGIKNIKAITAVQTPDGGGGGGGGNISNSFTAQAQAPSFNVVGNSGINQLAQLQQSPVQAYVVSGEVTSAQSLDRNRIKNATL